MRAEKSSINHPELSGFGRLLSALTDIIEGIASDSQVEVNPMTENGSSPKPMLNYKNIFVNSNTILSV